MMWPLLTILALVLIALTVIAIENAAREEDLMHLHPPDDDDGISLREEEDPDGECQR